MQAVLSTSMDLPKDHTLRKSLEQYKQRFEESLEEFHCSIFTTIFTLWATYFLCAYVIHGATDRSVA